MTYQQICLAGMILVMLASLIIRLFQLVFFSQNIVFLSQQISCNNILAYFFSEAHRAEGHAAMTPRSEIEIKIYSYYI